MLIREPTIHWFGGQNPLLFVTRGLFETCPRPTPLRTIVDVVFKDAELTHGHVVDDVSLQTRGRDRQHENIFPAFLDVWKAAEERPRLECDKLKISSRPANTISSD